MERFFQNAGKGSRSTEKISIFQTKVPESWRKLSYSKQRFQNPEENFPIPGKGSRILEKTFLFQAKAPESVEKNQILPIKVSYPLLHPVTGGIKGI